MGSRKAVSEICSTSDLAAIDIDICMIYLCVMYILYIGI